MQIRIGTRGSKLALWQAHWVAAELAKQPGVEVTIVEIKTQGDERGETISGLNSQGVFTREIQNALMESSVDVAVHSLKDLPTEVVPGLQLTAVPERASARDVLISRGGQVWAELAQGAIIGTGSTRRRAQLWHARPDLRMADIRGNVDTRLRKLREGQYDCLVLAEAGLRRLELDDAITEVLPETLMLPAVGQGALGIETRCSDDASNAVVGRLDDSATHAAVVAERALLAQLRGGCLAPIGAWARAEGSSLALSAVVLSHDGTQRLFAESTGTAQAAERLGIELGNQLLNRGAAELIGTSRALGA